MPEGLDARFWDQTTGSVNFPDLTKSFGELTAFKQAADERAAAVPQDYKPDLPGDFKLPEGFEFSVDANRAALPKLKEWAKEAGLTQEAFSKLMAIKAEDDLVLDEAERTHFAGEQKKLGENYDARAKAVDSFLKANLSTEHYEALKFDQRMFGALAFEAIETLIGKVTKASVPGALPEAEAKKPPTSMAERWYGNQKAS